MKPRSKVFATKVGSTFSDEEVFAEGTKWSQRTFFYKNATESIRAGRPLAASIYYHKNGRGMVSVFSNFWDGRARVVQVDGAGNLSFAKHKVKSTDSTKVENAVDNGKRLADASEVLANTAFIEANRGALIVFDSKNATALTGGKEIQKGYYLVDGSKKTKLKVLQKRLPDAVETDPDKYKVILENDRIRVFDYTDKPGEKTKLHHHPDSVVYMLGPFKRKFTLANGKSVVREVQGGEVAWNDEQLHIGENVGDTNTHVLIVELKEPRPVPDR